MKRTCDTSKFEAKDIANKVQLVEISSHDVLVDVNRISKRTPTDLVELAVEIQKADSFVHANACNKLQVIAQQVRFLQQQAQSVLVEAKQNADLHHVACNFVKVPGNVYHLYLREGGQRYFSMLSPEEWTSSPHKYLGSYRLEYDHSWTPLENLDKKDVENTLINKILQTNEGASLQLALEQTPMDL